MKRWLIVIALCGVAWGQCVITSPSSPPKVNGGAMQNLTISGCGTTPTCAVVGPGSCSISGSTVTYTAPVTAHPQNESRGVQELPNNSVFNVPVGSLPINSHNTTWLSRIKSFDTSPYIKFYPSFVSLFDNVVTNSTPQQTMHFFYSDNSNGWQDTAFPQPQKPNWIMQNGTSSYAFSGFDRHQFTMNPTTGQNTEVYNLYQDFKTSTFTAGNPTTLTWTTNSKWAPALPYTFTIAGCTGAWTGANGTWNLTTTSFTPGASGTGTFPFNSSTLGSPTGCKAYSLGDGYECATCNSQSGQQFNPGSNALLGGTNAGGTPLGALSVKVEESYRAWKEGRTDLGHAIFTTITNQVFSAYSVWPATLNAFGVTGYQNLFVTCTNASPTVCTLTSSISGQSPCFNGSTWGYSAGCNFTINVFGMTGGWVGMNGFQTATGIDDTHMSVAFNATGAGVFPTNQTYYVPDFVPYGATVRLKSSFSNSCVCTTEYWCGVANVWLNTFKNYGLVFADGTTPGDDWDSGFVSSEFMPKEVMDAADNMRANGNGGGCLSRIYNNLEFVDRTGQQISTNPNNLGATNTNRVIVTVSGSGGTGNTGLDMILQGTAVGTDRERLAIASGTSHQLNVWVTGNQNTSLTYLIGSGITGATVSAGGVVTMPTCPTTFPPLSAIVTATAVADSTATAYIEVDCLPVSGDGSYRIALGNYSVPGFTDSHGNNWYGTFYNNNFNNHNESIGLWWGSQNGTWPGFSLCSGDTAWNSVTDQQLYNRSTDFVGDTPVEVAVPNGSYTVVLYGEPGFNGFQSGNTCGNVAGQNTFDVEVQGTVPTGMSNLDGFVLAGNQPYKPWTITVPATVSNGLLDITGRIRKLNGVVYGMSWGSVMITPGTLPPSISTTTCPQWDQNLSGYSCSLSGTGGTGPYSWSILSGTLPAGLTLQSGCTSLACLITGTPTGTGTSPFVVQLCDSTHLCGTANLSITIQPPPHITTTTLGPGTVGLLYSQILTSVGGVIPYTYARVSGSLPPGVFLTSFSGRIAGTPTTAGNYCATYTVTDHLGVVSAPSANLCINITGTSTLTVVTTSLPSGVINVSYGPATLIASGGTGPYTWAQTSGTLPTGLMLHSTTGIIDGTPTVAGTQSGLIFTVTDSLGNHADSVPLQIIINTAGQLGFQATGSFSATGNFSAK